MNGSTVLAPKEYRRQLERVHRMHAGANWNSAWGDEATNWERVCRNILMAQKIYEREDYGPLADLRELVALRLAPWLRPHRNP